MKNMKFDIKKMTKQWNNTMDSMNETLGYFKSKITTEQMSEMVQYHLFKLGCSWYNGKNICKSENYLTIDEDNDITHDSDSTWFKDENEAKEIGLEFFSIKPEPKYVNVRMLEKDYLTYNAGAETFNIDKWELIND